METSLIDIEYKVNEMIYKLYDDEVDIKERIDNFFNELYEIVYYERISLMFYKRSENGWDKQFSISHNWDNLEITMEKYKSYYINIDDTMSILSQNKSIVFRSSQILDQKQRRSTEYFQNFIKETEGFYSVEANVNIKSNVGLKCNFYLFRGSDKVDFSEKEEHVVRMFQPHLERVLSYYGESGKVLPMTFSFDNSTTAASVLLDERFNIIRVSKGYERMREDYGRLLDERIVNACFAMKKMDSSGSELKDFGMRLDDMPFYVEIVKSNDNHENFKYNYCCMICDISKIFAKTLESIKEKYELTERESSVLNLLIDGNDAKEIAGILFISVPAVKKYCTSLYCKLGINSRNQIINILNFSK